MKYITTTNTLLGKHNVTSNHGWLAIWKLQIFQALFVAATAKPESITNDLCFGAKTVSIATTYSLCNLIRQTDRSSKHLNLLISLCVHIVSSWLCLSASLTLLCFSGLAVIMEHWLRFVILSLTPALWIMHCNHSLTNMLGMSIYKTPEWNRQNTKISLVDSTTVIGCQGLFLPPRLCLYVWA